MKSQFFKCVNIPLFLSMYPSIRSPAVLPLRLVNFTLVVWIVWLYQRRFVADFVAGFVMCKEHGFLCISWFSHTRFFSSCCCCGGGCCFTIVGCCFAVTAFALGRYNISHLAHFEQQFHSRGFQIDANDTGKSWAHPATRMPVRDQDYEAFLGAGIPNSTPLFAWIESWLVGRSKV